MSHNTHSYRKKIDKKNTESCKKIDLLFKQKALANAKNVQERSVTSDNIAACSSLAAKEKDDSPTNDDADMLSESSSSSGEETSDIADSVLVPDNRMFDTTKYERAYPWLYFSASKSGYCCKYCEFYFRNPLKDHAYVARGVTLGKHPGRKMKIHENSENHIKAAGKYFAPTKQSVFDQVKEHASKSSSVKHLTASNYIKVLFKSAYFLTRKRWAVCENLEDFMKNFLGEDLKIDTVVKHLELNPNIVYTSPSSVQEILESLSFVFEDDTLQSLRSAACYALMADESTDEGNRNQFAIVAKFLYQGKVQDLFVGLVRVTSATAENLMTAIERFLMAKGVPLDKAVLVGFDGCNTMSGENKGIQRRFRHIVPHQLYIHCRNHRLALCVKHLVKDYRVLQDLDELLIAIWKLFAYSPQRYAVFKEVQETYNLTQLSFIKAVSTRWLSHGRACQRLLDRFEPILDALDTIYHLKREPEVYGLRQMLANKNMIAAAAVFCDMLAPLCTFSDYLQGDVHFTLVNEKVSALVDKLHDLVDRFRRVGQGDVDIGLQFSKVESLWQEIDERTDFARRLRGPPPVTIHQFAEEFAVPIVYSLVGEVEDAFHCSEVLQSFSVFNIRNVPDSVADVVNNFGQFPIRILANHYGSIKEDTFSGHRNVANPVYTSAQILCEFEGFKHEMRSIKRNATTEQLDDPQFLLRTIMEDAVLSHDYPAMQYLVLLSVLVPTSTAVVERVFSLMNSVCTPLRSSLKQQTLDHILRVVHSGPHELSSVQLDRAIAHFSQMKDRMLDF